MACVRSPGRSNRTYCGSILARGHTAGLDPGTGWGKGRPEGEIPPDTAAIQRPAPDRRGLFPVPDVRLAGNESRCLDREDNWLKIWAKQRPEIAPRPVPLRVKRGGQDAARKTTHPIRC